MITLGNKVIVTDPCYNLDVCCNYVINNVLTGQYTTSVKLVDVGSWGNRVAELQAIHINHSQDTFNWELVYDDIGVDSGQCGIYNFLYRLSYGVNVHHSFFYSKACRCTDEESQYGEQDNAGVTSRSGFGDGTYNLYVAKNEDQAVIGIKIVFIEDEESQEDED